MEAADDDLEQASLNFISCLTWIRRGAAKLTPEKLELGQEELETLIGKTKAELSNLNDEEKEDESDEEEEKEDDSDESEKMEGDAESEDDAVEADEDAKIAKEYGLDKYDDEDEEVMMGMENLTMYTTKGSDPYLTNNGESDSEEEDDFNLLPTDNLIAVGHIEGDAAILEVYVYNAEEAHLYVHHETFLPALPLCMEWMDYVPDEPTPGNLLAVGSMAPVIDIWDLDVVGTLEPEFSLGRKRNKRKKIAGIGHKDAVLSLSWNKRVRNLLASGSADKTVLLWDMSQQQVATTLPHPEKIQALQFHPFEIQTLASGCCDGQVRVYDCRSESCQNWRLDGEIERVVWDHFNPFCLLASTEAGSVYYVDVRAGKPLWHLNAHSAACTGLALSHQCPGCLVTASQDKTFKVWDVSSGTPSFIAEHDFKLGGYSVASACPDAPFAFCLGGDNHEDNFKVWDIRQSASVLNRFEKRQLVQPLLHSSGATDGTTTGLSGDETGAASSSAAGSK